MSDMELLTLENINRQVAEMWDAISQTPDNDPNKDYAYKQGQEIEAKLRKDYARQEALRDSAHEFLVAVTGHEAPQLYRISWLETLLREVNKPEMYTALIKQCQGDSEAVCTMLSEIQAMTWDVKKIIKKLDE